MIKKLLSLCMAAALLCTLPALPTAAAAQNPPAAAAVSEPGYSGPLAMAPQLNAEWMNRSVILTDGNREWAFPLSLLAQTPAVFTSDAEGRSCRLTDPSALSNFVIQVNQAYETIPTVGNETIYNRAAASLQPASTGMFLQLRREFASQLIGAVEQQLGGVLPPADIRIDLNGGFLVGYPVGGHIITAGTCTTSLSGSSASRISNVTVAASRINGLVLMPGQEISVSTVILPRTSANGYREAGVYLNGETVPGMGGGICQLSSTTYNAAITSGLTILERHPHSMPVHYLNLGLDAAISSGSKDLRIRNDYDLPVTLLAGVEGKRLTVSVTLNEYLLNGTTYKLWSTVPSHNVAKTYLSTYVNDVETARTLVGTSRYADPKPKAVNED